MSLHSSVHLCPPPGPSYALRLSTNTHRNTQLRANVPLGVERRELGEGGTHMQAQHEVCAPISAASHVWDGSIGVFQIHCGNWSELQCWLISWLELRTDLENIFAVTDTA